MGTTTSLNNGRRGFGEYSLGWRDNGNSLRPEQGVVICVTSLVMAMAQDHLDAFAVCYTKAVDRLQRVRTL